MELTKQQPECQYCNGTGSISVNELTERFCECAYLRALMTHLGPEISHAPMLQDSPFFVDGENRKDPPLVDKTVRNLMIFGYWYDIIPHLKWCLVAKGLKFYTKIVTDEKLKNVWLGNEKYSSKSRKNREEGVTYNSLGDLIGDNYNLLIIRLGCLGYKNIAMPGILKEALMIRQVSMLPTWLVAEPDNPFVPGHFSYSDDVHSYIAHNKFEVLRISESAAAKEASFPKPLATQVDEDGTISMGTDTTVEQPTRPQPTKFSNPVTESQGMSMEGLEGAPGKSWKNKKKRSGGGPDEGGL